MTGTVKASSVGKSFAFIKGEDNKEYFFHRDDYLGHWDDLVADINDIVIRVDFIPTTTAKGLRGQNVSRLDHPNQSGG